MAGNGYEQVKWDNWYVSKSACTILIVKRMRCTYLLPLPRPSESGANLDINIILYTIIWTIVLDT